MDSGTAAVLAFGVASVPVALMVAAGFSLRAVSATTVVLMAALILVAAQS